MVPSPLTNQASTTMDSSPTFNPFSPTSLHHPQLFHHYHHHHPPPLHHQHYHIHPSPHCPFHNLMLHPITHLPTCPLSTSHGPTTQNTLSTFPPSFKEGSNSQVFESHEAPMEYAQMTQDGDEQFGAEEDEEPVFVLTDEWREFFAKSEAKRRLAKKQAKKKGKS